MPSPSWAVKNVRCSLCNYMVIVTQPDPSIDPGADYRWYCSNKSCVNHHPGEHKGDTEGRPSWVHEVRLGRD